MKLPKLWFLKWNFKKYKLKVILETPNMKTKVETKLEKDQLTVKVSTKVQSLKEVEIIPPFFRNSLIIPKGA